jgi:hypothetical protein
MVDKNLSTKYHEDIWTDTPTGERNKIKTEKINIRRCQTNSVAFSLQANYTNWAPATCQWNLVPTLADRGVSHGQHRRSLTVVNLSFLDRNYYFSFQVALNVNSQIWVDPIPDPLAVPGNWTRDLWVCNQELSPLDHRGGQIRCQIRYRATVHYPCELTIV